MIFRNNQRNCQIFFKGFGCIVRFLRLSLSVPCFGLIRLNLQLYSLMIRKSLDISEKLEEKTENDSSKIADGKSEKTFQNDLFEKDTNAEAVFDISISQKSFL